jgi:hypothetical protein
VQNTAQANAMNSNTGAVYPVPVAPPTGTVSVSGFPSGVPTSATLSAAVDPANQGGTQAVEGVANFIIPAGTASGTYTVNFSYSGDGNYAGIPTGQSQYTYSIPVVNTNGDGAQTSVTTATMSGSISPNSTIAITGTVTGTSGHPAPSNAYGGILVYSMGYYINEISVTPGSGTTSTFATVLSSQALPQGANQVTLQYTGDSVYNPSAFTLNGGNNIANPLSDFTLVPNTTIVPVSISSGANSSTDTINVASVNGFTGTVSLSCAVPSPLSCTITPSPTLASSGSATSTLTINVPAGAANGNFNVAITGKDSTGTYIHTLGITADVTGEVSTPTFALTNGGAITVVQGATTGNTSTMSVTPANAFTGTVNLSCATTTSPSGATSPVTCSIPASVSVTTASAVTATLTANSTATTTPGSYVITVTATSGSVTQTSTVNVTVTSAVAPTFTISATSPSSAVSPGTNATSTVTVTGTGGYPGSVALTCTLTGSPSGASDLPSCSITSGSPVTVNSNGTPSAPATATVTSTAATADLVYPKVGKGKGWLGAGSGALLALLVFFGIPARRRSWRAMLGILIAMAALGVMSSCGGGGSSGGGGGTTPSNPGTTAGTYTFTVTGTGTPSVGGTPAGTFTVSFN